MKSILIIAATILEVKPLIDSGFEKIGSNDFRHETNNSCTDVLITGIGGVATASVLSKRLETYNYDIVINAGIAGSLNNDFELGDVVNVISDTQGDLGIEQKDGFLNIFDAELEHRNRFPYSNGLLINNSIYAKYLKLTEQLKKARGITVNTAHGNHEQIIKFKEYYPEADIETMESAAFFYSCILAGVPFIAARSISNVVEERNKNNWNISLAVKNLNDLLLYWIHN